MTISYKTYSGKSEKQAEGVNPYISANYVTCGCYGVYASKEEMPWTCGDAMWCNDSTQAVSLNIEVYDELIDWAVGRKSNPFFMKYTLQDMLGNMERVCTAVEHSSGAITITDKNDEIESSDPTRRFFCGDDHTSTLVILVEDLIKAVLACHDMTIDDQAYCEAWYHGISLEERRRHHTKDETEEDRIRWKEVRTDSILRADGRKLAYKQRWNVLP